jgi:hypothetical protein
MNYYQEICKIIHEMKKSIIQILIFCCILIEAILLIKIINTCHLFIEKLLICSAITVMLLLIKLINHLSNITYKNEEKNKFN